jgi:hypothetical protein
MRRIWIAIRAFFLILFNAEVAQRVEEVLATRGISAVPKRGEETKPPLQEVPSRRKPARSEAITLLATLQREARFVDFIKEPLTGFSDAQIGAVVRDIHRDCGAVLERLFALRPIVNQEEGAELEVPEGFDAGRFRLVGNVTGKPPFRGRLMHHGWEATICELPAWSGSESAARTIAPVEVELK